MNHSWFQFELLNIAEWKNLTLHSKPLVQQNRLLYNLTFLWSPKEGKEKDFILCLFCLIWMSSLFVLADKCEWGVISIVWSLTYPEDYIVEGDYPAKYVGIRDVAGCHCPQEQKGQWYCFTADMLWRQMSHWMNHEFIFHFNLFWFEWFYIQDAKSLNLSQISTGKPT